MRSLDKIFQLMEANQAPFWKLKYQEGRNWVDCGTYLPGRNDDTAAAPIDKKKERDIPKEIDASQTRLTNIVEINDEGSTLFSIELLCSGSSHGSGKFGPFSFTQDGSEVHGKASNDRGRSPSDGDGLGALGKFLPNGLGDILAMDRSHGSLQMQMQLLQADKTSLERERDAFREEKANARADAKEKANEFKEQAIAEGKRQIDHERQLFEIEKLQFQNLKDSWQQQKEVDGSTMTKAKDVLGFVTDLVHKKLTGTDGKALAGTNEPDDNDPNWALCEKLAQDVFTVGDINFTTTVVNYTEKLKAKKNPPNE